MLRRAIPSFICDYAVVTVFSNPHIPRGSSSNGQREVLRLRSVLQLKPLPKEDVISV